MIRVIWHNGSQTSGETWREVEDNVRAAQWTPFKSRREFRAEMRQRAFVWSGIKPKPAFPHETSHGFLSALADSGMFMIIENDNESESS